MVYGRYQIQLLLWWYIKSARIRSFSGLYLPAFGLNTEIYEVYDAVFDNVWVYDFSWNIWQMQMILKHVRCYRKRRKLYLWLFHEGFWKFFLQSVAYRTSIYLIKTIFTLKKDFWSYKPPSVTKWMRFTQFLCYLLNINCLEQSKTIQQTKRKKNAFPCREFALCH